MRVKARFLPPHLNPLPLWGEEIFYNADLCNLVLDSGGKTLITGIIHNKGGYMRKRGKPELQYGSPGKNLSYGMPN